MPKIRPVLMTKIVYLLYNITSEMRKILKLISFNCKFFGPKKILKMTILLQVTNLITPVRVAYYIIKY